MAITPAVATALGGAATTTSFTITIPATVNNGDLLTVWFTHRGTGNGAVADDSGVGSWTRKGGIVFGSFSVQCYYKRVTNQAVERGATVTGSSLTNSCAGVLIADRGVISSGDPFEVFTGESNASADETHAQITTTTNGALVGLAVGNSPDLAISGQSTTSPGALTERAELLSTGGTDSAIAVATELKATAGATGALTWTQTDAATGSIAFAITPAPPATTASLQSTSRATPARGMTTGMSLVDGAATGRATMARGIAVLLTTVALASTARATPARGVAGLTTGAPPTTAALSAVGRATPATGRTLGINLVVGSAPGRATPARGTGQLSQAVGLIATGRAAPGRGIAALSAGGIAGLSAIGHATPARGTGVLATRVALSGTGQASPARGSATLQMQGTTAALAATGRAAPARGQTTGITLVVGVAAGHATPARGIAQLSASGGGGTIASLVATGRATPASGIVPGELIIRLPLAPGRATAARATAQLTTRSALTATGRATPARDQAALSMAGGTIVPLASTGRATPARGIGTPLTQRVALQATGRATTARAVATLRTVVSLVGTGRVTAARGRSQLTLQPFTVSLVAIGRATAARGISRLGDVIQPSWLGPYRAIEIPVLVFDVRPLVVVRDVRPDVIVRPYDSD